MKPRPEMKSRPEKKDYRAAPPVNGLMICHRGDKWNVMDLNPERVTVKCPVCGGNTSIRQGLQNEISK